MNTYKYIDGYENYIIFRTGKIYNQKKGIFMKPTQNDRGYMRIGLCKDGKQKHFQVHRLLALTFIPNPLNKPEVDHINRITDDNRIENLRWATKKENNQNKINNNEELYIYKIYTKNCNQGYIWVFQITIDGKQKKIKSSVDKEKLIKFRDAWFKNNPKYLV